MVFTDSFNTLAIMQDTRLVSSLPVTATTMSASLMPAFTRILGKDDPPRMVLISASSSSLCNFTGSLSTIVRSFSCDKRLASVLPTAPAPKMTIFTSLCKTTFHRL